MQICDLLSHASQGGFHNCNPAEREILRGAFGPYDFSIVLPELLSRVDQFVTAGSHGSAILALAERLIRSDPADRLAPSAAARLEKIVERLSLLGAASREPELKVLESRLERVVDYQRDLEFGFRLATWLQTTVVDPLQKLWGAISTRSTASASRCTFGHSPLAITSVNLQTPGRKSSRWGPWRPRQTHPTRPRQNQVLPRRLRGRGVEGERPFRVSQKQT